MRVAYLAGRYPAVSHTFIAREIDAVREHGIEISPFSVHTPSPNELITEADRERAAQTRNIQPPRWREVARAHLAAIGRSPGRYLQILGLSQRLSPPGVRARLWHLFYFAEAILLWRWMRQIQSTHVHVHFANASSMIALLYAEFARSEGASWSFTMHGPTEFDEVQRFRLGEKVARARFVACISHFARSQLMKVSEPEYWDRLELVRCGVDTEAWPSREVPPPHRELRVLCVARLVPDKGVGLLVDAVAELIGQNVAISVEVVGDGPDRDALEQHAGRLKVSDHVRFHGAVGQDRIKEHYRAADVFCLPSFAEGVPIVLMEAMALEVPVIAPRVMGIPELVEDGVSGMLLEPGSRQALVSVLGKAAAQPDELRGMGQAGRAKVQRDFELGASGARLAELFRAI